MVPAHAVVLQKKNSEFKKLRNENRSATDPTYPLIWERPHLYSGV